MSQPSLSPLVQRRAGSALLKRLFDLIAASAGLLLLAGIGGAGQARMLCWLALLLPWPIAWAQLLLPGAGPFLGASGVLYGWWAALAWQGRAGWTGRLLAALLLLLSFSNGLLLENYQPAILILASLAAMLVLAVFLVNRLRPDLARVCFILESCLLLGSCIQIFFF
ncbi:hypothetical protein C3E97_030185, partial [Pseudomonas sp. MWU12-2115]|uniref:hypothetical protein n=1 Tax=Pseudomonas sp. MWU12-2115 TaxID=2071713 RepID=UPI000DFB1E26